MEKKPSSRLQLLASLYGQEMSLIPLLKKNKTKKKTTTTTTKICEIIAAEHFLLQSEMYWDQILVSRLLKFGYSSMTLTGPILTWRVGTYCPGAAKIKRT